MKILFLLVSLFSSAQGQFGFFPGFGFQPPPPPPPQVNPWGNLFGSPFQQFPAFQTIPTTTTTIQPPIESVPNPDLEVGNFAVPNPRMWPVGPDWNDPRNTWTSEQGWGGRDFGRKLITATSPITTHVTQTTTIPMPPQTTTMRPTLAPVSFTSDLSDVEKNDLIAESAFPIVPIIRPGSLAGPPGIEPSFNMPVQRNTEEGRSTMMNQMTTRQIESDHLVRHRSSSRRGR